MEFPGSENSLIPFLLPLLEATLPLITTLPTQVTGKTAALGMNVGRTGMEEAPTRHWASEGAQTVEKEVWGLGFPLAPHVFSLIFPLSRTQIFPILPELSPPALTILEVQATQWGTEIFGNHVKLPQRLGWSKMQETHQHEQRPCPGQHRAENACASLHRTPEVNHFIHLTGTVCTIYLQGAAFTLNPVSILQLHVSPWNH